MKNSIKLFLLMTLCMACYVQLFAHVPVFGHRGGVWGVQNTSGAFIEGAKYFDGLETDVKVTKDGVLICSHDGSLSNFYKDAARTMKYTADESKFTTHTWAQLKGLKFYEYNTWTKQTYGDTLCTFGQYLDICHENKVIAMVELKWADGYFTTASTNGMPILMSELKQHDMLNHCVIFSTMTNCLEWMRKYAEYDSIPVAYLGMTGASNPSYATIMAWAKKTKNADIDPECYQIESKDNVTEAHDNGIRVHVWNIGGKSMYTKYKGYGVDYMTADSLRPKFLSDYTPRTDFLDVRPNAKPDTITPGKEDTTIINPCNPYGWTSGSDMYQALATDVIAAKKAGVGFTFCSEFGEGKREEFGDPNVVTEDNEGIAYDIQNFDTTFFSTAPYAAKWRWLLTYIEDRCTEESKTKPSIAGAYLSNVMRWNLAAFFGNTQRTAWPVSPDYTNYGVSSKEYETTWGYQLVCAPTDAMSPSVEDNSTTAKVIRHGMVYIRHKGILYDLLGNVVE